MKTIQIKLYEFAELDEKGKDKALKELSDINVDYDWYEPIFYDFQAIVKTLGITLTINHIHFSGFYSQGDGSAFKATVNLPELAEAVKNESWRSYTPHLELDLPVCEAENRILKLIKNEAIDISPQIVQPTRSYYVRAELNNQFPYNNHRFDRIEAELEKLEQWLQVVAEKLNRYLYKSLQDDYDYQTSDKAMIEAIEANEYHFMADGKLATTIERMAETNN
jgi:hypothetical protein